MPIKFKIYKAQPSPEPTQDVVLKISQELPEFTTLEAGDAVFILDARLIESALYNSLPGGTYDQLLGMMLKRKASHFRVSYAS